MYSGFWRYLMILTGFAPALLIFWVINIYQQFQDIHLYIKPTLPEFLGLIRLHMFLILFFIVVMAASLLLRHATYHLTPKPITLKSLKPAEANGATILFSWLLPLFKLTGTAAQDYAYLIGLFLITLVYGFMYKNSNHYNITYRILLRYQFYEVTTTAEATYLLISKRLLAI